MADLDAKDDIVTRLRELAPEGMLSRQIDDLDALREAANEIERLRALAASAPGEREAGDGWQPIESAPKDGREILGFIPGSRLGNLQEEPDIIDAVFWKANTGGWRHRSDDHIHLNVTHWRPLPAPPPPVDEK